ncbi:MAG: ATP-binding protein [Dialister pneumosintes]
MLKNVQEIIEKMKVANANLSEEELKAWEQAKQEEKAQKTAKRIKQANIPKRYLQATFDNLDRWKVPSDIQKHYEVVKEYALDFKDNKRKGNGIVFSGSVGRMKTTMAVAVLQEIIKQGYSGYFISMPELMDKLVSMSKGNYAEFRAFEHAIQTTSLLILDDMGAEYPNDWVLNKVDAIITHRYNAMLPVIITTNLKRSEMQQRYMQRVYDRLKQTSILIVDGGESLRTTFKNKGNGVTDKTKN